MHTRTLRTPAVAAAAGPTEQPAAANGGINIPLVAGAGGWESWDDG